MRDKPDMLSWLDLPPVWLALALALAFGLDRLAPGLGAGLGWTVALGKGLVLLGLVLMALGLFELLRRRTTFVPRQKPRALAASGIYRLSRNPIYLGDALVLAGAVLWWDVLPALVLVPAFVALITQRFIRGEEAGLRAAFGAEAEGFFARTRRWL